jgi:uncharacterized membrane protein (DUF4010 family)
MSEPFEAAALAFIGVALSDIAIVRRHMKDRGPGNAKAYAKSPVYWLVTLVFAMMAATVAYICHKAIAVQLGWLYFGFSISAIAAQYSSLPAGLAADDPPA